MKPEVSKAGQGVEPNAWKGSQGAEPDAGKGSQGAEPDAGKENQGAEPDAGKGSQGAEPDAGKENRGAEKRRYSKGTILRLGKYMLHYKWLLLAAIICTLGSNLFSLIGPKLTGLCIGAIELGKGAVDFQTVFYYAAWMAAFYVISALMAYGLQVLMLAISRKGVYRMRRPCQTSWCSFLPR